MSDFFKDFKNQTIINENWFNKVFSKTGKTEPMDTDFVQMPSGIFIFGQKSSAKEVNTPASIPFLKEFDWKNSKLNFILLPGTEFHAAKINIDLKEQVITYFKGVWESGPFFGKTFQGIFRGSSFQGNFSGPYTDYESHPATFVDGLFHDTTNKGILGLPNTVTLDKAKNKKFNIITIPVGYYLQFRSVNGITGYIKTLKRLDYTDSTFQFEILDGFAGQKTPRTISLPWNYFRQNWKFLEVNPKNPRNIGGLIYVPEGDYIKEIYISSAPATFAAPATGEVQFNPEKQYEFDLSKLPYLNIKALKSDAGEFGDAKAIFKFDSSQELEQFSKIISYIKSGTFSQDIKNVAKAIKYKEVDGYGPFKYLVNIFNGNEGKNIYSLLPQAKKKTGLAEAKGSIGQPNFKLPGEVNKPKNSNKDYWANKKRKPAPVMYNVTAPIEQREALQFGTIPSMQRLNDFIKYFVENMISKEGESNQEAQNLVISRLKTALGTDSMQKAAKQPETDEKGHKQEPGMNDTDFPYMKENVRKSVRNIINDNF